MNIDPRTILIVNLFGCLIMSFGLWTASIAFFKRAKFVKEWAIATLVQAFGWAVTGALRGVIPDGISIIGGNSLMVVSVLYYYSIIRQFFDRPTKLVFSFIYVLVFALSMYGIYSSELPQKFRVVAISLFNGIALLLVAYEIFYASKDHKISSRFTGYFFGFCGIFMLVRVFIYSFANIPPDQVAFAPGPIQDVTYLFFFVTSVMVTFGFLHMVADRFASDLLTSENNLQSALKEVQNLNQTKDKFMSIIAHDLKGPIGGIHAYLNLIDEDIHKYTKESLHKEVVMVKDTSSEVYNLLLNLLSWANSQSGELTFSPTKIPLHPLVESVVQVHTSLANNKSIVIQNQIPIASEVFADSYMIETILRNLVSNALKYTPVGGKVRIHSRETSDQVQILVSDTGKGIPEDLRETLFQFDKKKMSLPGTQGERGTGLGLVLCKEFVDRHGGTLVVESELDQGSDFIVGLPKG